MPFLEEKQTIGERIKIIRKKLNLNQQEFADLIEVKTKASISNFEKDERKPSFDNLINISKVGNVTIDWLLTGVKGSDKELREQIDKKNEQVQKLKTEVYKLSSEVAQLNKVAEAAVKYSDVKKKNISDRWKKIL